MTELDPTQDAPAPQAPAIDVEAIKAELMAQFDTKMNERISGIQSSYQAQLNQRDEQIRQLQAAQMSEEELEQLAIQENEERVAALEAQNWLLTKAQENAKAVELFQKVLSFEDPEEQFAFFAELAASQAAQPAQPVADPEPQVPDSDPNNPSIYSGAEDIVRLPDGRILTEELADSILKGMTHWPQS